MESAGAAPAGSQGQWGGVAHDNRRFLNGIPWVLRTGRECRGGTEGCWSSDGGAGHEWLMIDASHVKVYPHARGPRSRAMVAQE